MRADPCVGAADRSVARTHLGHVRTINEDRVFDCPEAGVWAVIDGMGGHRGGDVAAHLVVDALRKLVSDDARPGPDAILAALHAANDEIVARNADRGENAGATVVVLSRRGDALHLAWAGDSRCYRLRDGAPELLTRDHSVVQQLVDAGLLTTEAAARHPRANVVTRALGVAATCEIERRTVAADAGDRFLLCSDGLSRTLSPDGLHGGMEALADGLLAAALARDGSDNISLILTEHRPA